MQEPNNALLTELQKIQNELTQQIQKRQHNLEVSLVDQDHLIISFSQQKFKQHNKEYYLALIQRAYDLMLEQSAVEKHYSKNIHNYSLSAGYKLQWETDFITLDEIENPIICLQNDRIMMDPKFRDQKVFFQSILENQKANRQINLNDCELTQIFWTLKKELEASHKKKFNIYVYPNVANFMITMEEKEGNMQPYFFDEQHFQSFLHQNTLFLNQKYKNLQYFEDLNQTYGIEPIEILQTDEISGGTKQVDLQFKQDFYSFQKSLIQVQMDKHKINGSFIQVKPKKFDFIHSLQCRPEKATDYILHKIKFPENELAYCEHCGIRIQAEDYDTLFYDRNFSDAYRSLVQMIMIDGSFLPVVFLLPIFYRFQKDNKYGNIFIEYYTEKNPNKYHENERIYLFYRQGYKMMYYNYSELNENQIILQKKDSETDSEQKILESQITTISDYPEKVNNEVNSTDQIYFQFTEELEDDN